MASEVFLGLYTVSFIHVDGIYNWQCFPFTGLTAAEAIDKLKEILKVVKWTSLTDKEKKNKQTKKRQM